MSVYLFHGSDDVLVREAVSDKARELVGDQDRSLMLEEFDGDYIMAGATESAMTPPFLTERRIIVMRKVSAFGVDDLDVLAAYLQVAPDFTDMVIEWGSGRVSKVIAAALKLCGGQTIDPSPPTRANERREWWETQLSGLGLVLDAPAVALLIDWLGEDVTRLGGLAATLKSTYGDQRINKEKLEPFLGERGDTKPWDLTDGIDSGNAAKALLAARRLMNAGERHPLQIMAQLHGHYSRLAKLDVADVPTLAEAEVLLGAKGFAAEKALRTFRSLTGAGVRRAFELLAAADLDLRGSTGLEEDVVMDVLIARLAKLNGVVSQRR
ncbi:unannotated protein [freshwater metagenome]|uniref:DNA polymerase III subunit delta n=1 Tax=freshwater metagenome TaxID=449393 RepID=A0A6J6BU72_9ZZZZ|nr:DNA polymerase III subunit delta [Actinomycetota bacterium]MSY07522.1 DNA polymerase III subunit delta [Actinomycetota bacterium]MSZ37239.1 DNA polymerase III subunit delta [Actinomycetota bacterium]MSZ99096.1 DNA polymerase III subunit delta [Actinomycetota bacterium]MTA09969.1 DNA polymerase III subunit delta [Actinomycetota bacterium]